MSDIKHLLDIGDTIKIKDINHRHCGKVFFVKCEPQTWYDPENFVPKKIYILKNETELSSIKISPKFMQGLKSCFKLDSEEENKNLLSSIFVPCKIGLIEKV